MKPTGPKHLAFGQLAIVARALGSGHRLELLDLLAQGDRSVDSLARASGLTFGNVSQHLHRLQRAGLVSSQRAGRQVIYRLGGEEVLTLVRSLRHVAEAGLAELERIVTRYYAGRDGLEPVTRKELLARIERGNVTVLDVRPAEEYAVGHLPGAINIPVHELGRQLRKLPRTREIVAYCRGPYCVYSYEAVDVLRPKGFKVRRLLDGYLEWRAAGLPIEAPVIASAA